MTQYIDKDALVAEIKRLNRKAWELYGCSQFNTAYDKVLQSINALEVKEVDLELIVGWFEHIAQMADDRKTLNGEVMEDWAALDEIKCLAKNSADFIQRHYKAQKGECV